MGEKRTREELIAVFKARKVGDRLVATVSLATAAQALGLSQSMASLLRRRAGIEVQPRSLRPLEFSRAEIIRACRAWRDDDGTWRASTTDAVAAEALGIKPRRFTWLRNKYDVKPARLVDQRRTRLTQRQLDQARKLARNLPLREVALAFGVSVARLREQGVSDEGDGWPRDQVMAAFKVREIDGRLTATVTAAVAAPMLGVTASGANRILRRAGIAPYSRTRRARELLGACRAVRGADGTWRATVSDADAGAALGVGKAHVRVLRKRHGVKAKKRGAVVLSSEQLDGVQALTQSRSMGSISRAVGMSVAELYRNGVLPGRRTRRLQRRELLDLFGAQEIAGQLVATTPITKVSRKLGVNSVVASAIRNALGIAPRSRAWRTQEILDACRAEREADGTWRATASDGDAAAQGVHRPSRKRG